MTLYRLATSPADYRKCHALMRASNPTSGNTPKLGYPTVVAEKDGTVVGFISTVRHPKLIVAGPVHAPNGIIALRLFEAYENFLWHAGVRGYLIPAKEHDHGSMLQRAGFDLLEQNNGVNWFRRELRAA